LTSWEVELTSEKELVDRELRNYKYLKKKSNKKYQLKELIIPEFLHPFC
jgi:hypothetical protein